MGHNSRLTRKLNKYRLVILYFREYLLILLKLNIKSGGLIIQPKTGAMDMQEPSVFVNS